jgi:serine protease
MNSRKRVPLLSLLLLFAILSLPLPAASALPLASRPAQATRDDSVALEPPTGQIIIKYRAGALREGASGATGPASAAQMARLSETAGTPLAYFRPMSGDAHVLRLSARRALAEVQALADRLSALPEVEYAEPDAIMQHTLTPNDPRYNDQWHYFTPSSNFYGINAPAAWDITTGAAGIVVAVVDTGITNHADLSGRTVPGYDFISDSQVANDGDGRDGDASDPGDWITPAENSSGYFQGCRVVNSSWHGTHVAGTIGAASNNGVGVAGINWNSLIQPVRVLGKCGGMISDIADGMRWAAGLPVPGAPTNPTPAKVINASLGGAGTCGSTYQDAVNAIIGAGVTPVIAAGNSNTNAIGFRPGNCDGVITVAATNRNGSRASYSNYGATVEISAPGGETNPTSSNGVLSTLNTGTQGPAGDTYTFYQGTSMAAPHVAGVASLLYSLNPAITPAQVLTTLQSTVTAFPGGSTCNTSICGSGIVNAGSAVGSLAPNPTPTLTGINPTSATAGGPALTLTVNGTGFVNSSVVRWNGANRTTTYVSGTQLTAAITPADIAAAGTANVTVFNPAPGGGTSAAATFTVNNPVPTITGLSPSWAPPGSAGFILTINGAGFVNGSQVRWNGANRTTTYVGPTQLTAAINAGDIATAGAANVTVFNPTPGGGASSAATFTIGNPVPVITMLSPFWAAPGGSGFTLTIHGTDFVNGAVVRWNGANRTTNFVSSTRLTAVILQADIAATGTATITVSNPAPMGGPSSPASFLIGAPRKLHLPIILKNFPPLPGIPVLNPIDNADGDGNYNVCWTATTNATAYVLEEDDNASFTSPTTVYNSPVTCWTASNKPAGTYYYRVKGTNAWGGSGWSTMQSVVVPPQNEGIYGHITFQGAAAAGIGLVLRFWNGSSWSTAATTTTDGAGSYRFLGVASLGAGQSYYVRFGPNSSNSAYLWSWWGPTITSYTSGDTVPGGNFDIANVSLQSPPGGAATTLPATLSWQQRGFAIDTYRVRIFSLTTSDNWLTVDLGNVGSFNMTSLPPGANFGTEYGWSVQVMNGPDNLGESYYYRRITFVSGLAQSPAMLSEWVAQAPARELDRPTSER